MHEREWSYQVGHGSCGLYVQKMVYIVIESKMSIAPLLPLEGQIHRHDRMLHKVSNHSKKPKRRNRGEKYRGEEED